MLSRNECFLILYYIYIWLFFLGPSSSNPMRYFNSRIIIKKRTIFLLLLLFPLIYIIILFNSSLVKFAFHPRLEWQMFRVYFCWLVLYWVFQKHEENKIQSAMDMWEIITILTRLLAINKFSSLEIQFLCFLSYFVAFGFITNF